MAFKHISFYKFTAALYGVAADEVLHHVVPGEKFRKRSADSRQPSVYDALTLQHGVHALECS